LSTTIGAGFDAGLRAIDSVGVLARAATARAFEREEPDGVAREATEEVGKDTSTEEVVEETVDEVVEGEEAVWMKPCG
jgi:hypothetical protein